MSYSPNKFAGDLERFLHGPSGTIDRAKISDWAYRVRLDNLNDIDADVDKWLLQLGAMSMGQEFEFSALELRDIVDRAKARDSGRIPRRMGGMHQKKDD